MKHLSVLGSTGSIGDSTLKVVDNLKNKFKIKYLSANNNYKKLGFGIVVRVLTRRFSTL